MRCKRKSSFSNKIYTYRLYVRPFRLNLPKKNISIWIKSPFHKLSRLSPQIKREHSGANFWMILQNCPHGFSRCTRSRPSWKSTCTFRAKNYRKLRRFDWIRPNAMNKKFMVSFCVRMRIVFQENLLPFPSHFRLSIFQSRHSAYHFRMDASNDIR